MKGATIEFDFPVKRGENGYVKGWTRAKCMKATFLLVAVRRFRRKRGYFGDGTDYVEYNTRTKKTFTVRLDGSRNDRSTAWPLSEINRVVKDGSWVEV